MMTGPKSRVTFSIPPANSHQGGSSATGWPATPHDVVGRSLRIGVEHGDPGHVGRARRAKRNAGNDNDAILRFGKAFASGQFAGALHHVVDVMRVLGDDSMDAPNESETAGRLP